MSNESETKLRLREAVAWFSSEATACGGGMADCPDEDEFVENILDIVLRHIAEQPR